MLCCAATDSNPAACNQHLLAGRLPDQHSTKKIFDGPSPVFNPGDEFKLAKIECQIVDRPSEAVGPATNTE
jgi:hypothetical protein